MYVYESSSSQKNSLILLGFIQGIMPNVPIGILSQDVWIVKEAGRNFPQFSSHKALPLFFISSLSSSYPIHRLHSSFLFFINIYSRPSLSRLRLSRITAYLEEKIWSLFKHRNLTSGNKILWIRGEIAPQEQFLPFPTNFQYIFLTKGCSFVKFGCLICIFLNSENVICRSTDISKCFRGSLQLRDNESRLY